MNFDTDRRHKSHIYLILNRINGTKKNIYQLTMRAYVEKKYRAYTVTHLCSVTSIIVVLNRESLSKVTSYFEHSDQWLLESHLYGVSYPQRIQYNHRSIYFSINHYMR